MPRITVIYDPHEPPLQMHMPTSNIKMAILDINTATTELEVGEKARLLALELLRQFHD